MKNSILNWPSIMRDFANSNQSVTIFCKEKNIAISGFYRHKKLLSTTTETVQSRAVPKFVPVIKPIETSDFEGEHMILKITTRSGTVVEIPL